MDHFRVEASANNRDPVFRTQTRAIDELNVFAFWSVDTDTNGSRREFTAKLIGFSSSEKQNHNHPVSDAHHREHVSGGRQVGKSAAMIRCGACRWQETRIFLLDEKDHVYHGGKFAVHTLGVSILPGERVRARLEFVNTGFEVVELLTVRKGEHAAPYIPGASARALAMAAAHDRDLKDAYVNRAVA